MNLVVCLFITHLLICYYYSTKVHTGTDASLNYGIPPGLLLPDARMPAPLTLGLSCHEEDFRYPLHTQPPTHPGSRHPLTQAATTRGHVHEDVFILWPLPGGGEGRMIHITHTIDGCHRITTHTTSASSTSHHITPTPT